MEWELAQACRRAGSRCSDHGSCRRRTCWAVAGENEDCDLGFAGSARCDVIFLHELCVAGRSAVCVDSLRHAFHAGNEMTTLYSTLAGVIFAYAARSLGAKTRAHARRGVGARGHGEARAERGLPPRRTRRLPPGWVAAKGSQRNAPMLRPARPISSQVPWLAAQELHEDDEPWRRDETSCQNRGASSPMARLAAWHPLRWHNSNTSSLLDGLLVGRSASVRISATFAPPPLRTN